MQVFGLLNAHMFGMDTEPGEHVNWSEPDYFDESMFWDLGYESVEEYAQEMPHMIVFLIGTRLGDFDWEHNDMELRTITCMSHPSARYLSKHPWQRSLHFVESAVDMPPFTECPCPLKNLVVVD